MSKDACVNELCCGCSACSEVCPVKCISITANSEGFYQAFFDTEKCINCNKCMMICPLNHTKTYLTKQTYAFVSNVNEIYMRSSSGGVFSHIANYYLSQGGYVCACGFDSDLRAMHMIINEKNNIDNLRRSKYVQSYIESIFPKIKELLIKGMDVLFVGTPCQVGGLRNYLCTDFNNLLTIDLLCHGTPSPQMFYLNKKLIEKTNNKRLKRYEFRLKSQKHTNEYICTYIFDDGEIIENSFYNDPYFCEFYNNDSLNECCYRCPYAAIERAGDITIGDFSWIKDSMHDFDEYEEVSCIMINTEKGARQIGYLSQCGMLIPCSISEIKKRNYTLINPTDRTKYRDDIYHEINDLGYEKWSRKFYFSKQHLRHCAIVKKIKQAVSILMKNYR